MRYSKRYKNIFKDTELMTRSKFIFIKIDSKRGRDLETRPRGYKKNFMLNSIEHEIFPAHKC